MAIVIDKGQGKGVSNSWGIRGSQTFEYRPGKVISVWHAHFTGSDSTCRGFTSHLDLCRGGDKTLVIKCDMLTCSDDAKHGAHVYIESQGPDKNPNECYILATCAKHNGSPKNNEWNYPLEEDKNNYNQGVTKDLYGRPGRIKPNITGKKATSIEDIRDGMPIKTTAVLYEHIIRKDCALNATKGRSYEFN